MVHFNGFVENQWQKRKLMFGSSKKKEGKSAGRETGVASGWVHTSAVAVVCGPITNLKMPN